MTPTRVLTRAFAVAVLAGISLTAACNEAETALVIQNAQRIDAVLETIRSQSALSDEQLARLAKCESGNNPAAVSRSGKYRGLYQFDQRTWNGVAQSVLPEYVGVSPAMSPARVQDAMARALYAARGRSPWPVCGSRL